MLFVVLAIISVRSAWRPNQNSDSAERVGSEPRKSTCGSAIGRGRAVEIDSSASTHTSLVTDALRARATPPGSTAAPSRPLTTAVRITTSTGASDRLMSAGVVAEATDLARAEAVRIAADSFGQLGEGFFRHSVAARDRHRRVVVDAVQIERVETGEHIRALRHIAQPIARRSGQQQALAEQSLADRPFIRGETDVVADGRTERVGKRDATLTRGHRETGHAAARTFDRQLERIALDRRQSPEHDIDRLELPERSQQQSPAAHHQVVALDDVVSQRRRKVGILEVLDGIDAGDEDDDPGADSIGRRQRRQRLAQALPPFRLSHRRHDGCCFWHCARGDDTVEGGVAQARRNVDVVADGHEVARRCRARRRPSAAPPRGHAW